MKQLHYQLQLQLVIGITQESELLVMWLIQLPSPNKTIKITFFIMTCRKFAIDRLGGIQFLAIHNF